MMNDCFSCQYATADYEEYYGGGRRWFVDGCQNGNDIWSEEKCKDYRSINAFSDNCRNCPNNPANGGSGICHCVLGTSTIY